MAFTVTATPGGASFARGVDLQLTVLTNATEVGGAKHESANAASSTPGGSLTPNFSGSFVAFSISGDGITTMAAAATSNTYDYSPGGHTDTWCARMGHYSGTVTGGSALTYGASGAGGDDHSNMCAYEVPASGGAWAIDPSSPVGVFSDTGTSVTTSAISPPVGAVLVAELVVGGSGAGAGTTCTITDTSGLGLVWTKRAQSSTSDNYQPTFIFTATVGAPSGDGTPNLPLRPGWMRTLTSTLPAVFRQTIINQPDIPPILPKFIPLPVAVETDAAQELGGAASWGINGAWFTHNGQPQLMVNDESWSVLANGGLNHSGSFTATYDDFTATRAAQGYTSTLQSWCAFGTSFGTSGGHGSTGADSDGTTPFSTALDPTTTPNSTFWARRDYFIASAAAQGMRVLLNVTTPYLHQGSPNTAPQVSWTSTQWTAFGTFLGTRYASVKNLTWMVGDDYFNDINSNLTAFKTALRAAGANQPIAVQYYVETSSKFDEWSGSPGVPGTATSLASYSDWNHGYSYNVSYDIVEKGAGWNAANPSSKVPYLWGDGYFLRNAHVGLPSDYALMRRHIWWALSSGSKGFTVGDDDIWPWPSTALAEIQSDTFYTTFMPALTAYFKALPNWHLLEPDLSSALVTAGRGTHVSASCPGGFYGAGSAGSGAAASDDTYITASRTPTGSLAVIYASSGGTITIDQTKMGSGYTATWVDPKSLATSSATPGSTYNFTAKGNNSDGLNEWVLVLESTSTTVSVPIATESDAAQGIGRKKVKALPLATEADASQTLVRVKSKALPLSAETDAAQTLARSKVKALAIAAATNTAQALGRIKARLLPISGETDAAQTIVRPGLHSLPIAAETDAAQGIGRRKVKALPVAAEIEAAQTLGRVRLRALPIALATNTAQALAKVKRRLLPIGTETETAQTISRPGTFIRAAETDTAVPLGRVKRRALPTALETATALIFGRRASKALPVAGEVDTALGAVGSSSGDRDIEIVAELLAPRISGALLDERITGTVLDQRIT